jgi:hypothetical protein
MTSQSYVFSTLLQGKSLMNDITEELAGESSLGERIERRLSKRQALPYPIDVSVTANDHDTNAGKIRNVAQHGLFIETATGPEPGTHVRVLFKMSGGDMSYKLWGRVAHTASGGLGLAVDILESDSCAALSAVNEYAQS